MRWCDKVGCLPAIMHYGNIRWRNSNLPKGHIAPLPVIDEHPQDRRKSIERFSEISTDANARDTFPKHNISTEYRLHGSNCEVVTFTDGEERQRQGRNNADAKVREINNPSGKRIQAPSQLCSSKKCSNTKKDEELFRSLKYYFYRWKLVVMYMDSQHRMLFELLLWLPLMSMVLYIVFVEGELLYRYVA